MMKKATIRNIKEKLKDGFWYKECGSYCSWENDRLFISDYQSVSYYGDGYVNDGFRIEYMPLADEEIIKFYSILKERREVK